jgi:hypothetical protein
MRKYKAHAILSLNTKVMNHSIFLALSSFFLVIFEELLDATMSLKLPKGLWAGYQKNVCFIYKILDFWYFKKNKITDGST